jgi:hypothetical protein
MPAPDVLCQNPESGQENLMGQWKVENRQDSFHGKAEVIRFTMTVWFVLFVLVIGCVQAWTARIECVAGCGAGFESGFAKGAKLNEPFGIAFDQDGNGYICEHEGQKIIKVDSDGLISPFAGFGALSFGGKTQRTNQAAFNHPHGLIIAKDQQMYVADTLNHRVQKIDLKSGEIFTIAGTGQPGFSGDGGPATKAHLRFPYNLALGPDGSLHIADTGNNCVRRVAPRGLCACDSSILSSPSGS